jgi:hypothetical protein
LHDTLLLPATPCRALKKVEEAIAHYIERIRLGGWSEERFMSALNIADQAKIQWETGQLISPQVCRHTVYKAQ